MTQEQETDPENQPQGQNDQWCKDWEQIHRTDHRDTMIMMQETERDADYEIRRTEQSVMQELETDPENQSQGQNN